MINEKLLSKKYEVRFIKNTDIDDVYHLCIENNLYYKYHPPVVTHKTIEEDITILPPNKTLNDKYFVGFWDNNKLIAIMDLILDYPKEKVAFIGLFMSDVKVQRRGIGSDIIGEITSYLKSCGYNKIRLGVDKGNSQSFNFWNKNNFEVDTSYNGEYIVMEKVI